MIYELLTISRAYDSTFEIYFIYILYIVYLYPMYRGKDVKYNGSYKLPWTAVIDECNSFLWIADVYAPCVFLMAKIAQSCGRDK